MRRPLTRHLSEGGGSGVGATTDNSLGVGSGAGRRQLRSSAKEGGDERGYTWTCRDYSHHLSFADLLKAPAPPAECRGRATVSPEARSSAIHRKSVPSNTVIFALHNEGDHLCGVSKGGIPERKRERGHPHSSLHRPSGRSSIDRRAEMIVE